MSFFKPKVSFHLNIATSFSVITHDSSEIFVLKPCMLWTKKAYYCTVFRILDALMNVQPILHAIFETPTSGFIQILHQWSVPRKITPLYFLAQTLYTLDKFTKFLMSYLKPQVSFSLELTSLFNVMGDKSSILF